MNTEELKKLAMAATPGLWVVNDDPLVNEGAPHLMTADGYAIADFWGNESGLGLNGNERNADFIAAANPTAILALIEQHEAVNSELLATRDDNHSMMLEIHNLRIERDKLLAALELFMERVDEPPKSNCSCHLSPPCNDCVEYSGLREAFSDAHDAIAKAEG